MICDACGVEIQIGDFPFCPHGRATLAVHGDDIPGGQYFENGWESPRKFYSHSEHERALAAEGLEIRAKWAGEHDRCLTRWDTVNLEAAAALVQRGAEARAAKRWAQASTRITVTELDGGVTAKDLD